MADEDERKRTAAESARAKQLAERSATDLRLLHDAALSAAVPYSELARVKRATTEIKNLLSALGGK